MTSLPTDMTDKTSREFAKLLARAMEQPGVAETMAIYHEARLSSDAAQESMQLLQPRWSYQATNTSS